MSASRIYSNSHLDTSIVDPDSLNLDPSKDSDPVFQAFLRESGSGYGIRIQGFDDQKLSKFLFLIKIASYGTYP